MGKMENIQKVDKMYYRGVAMNVIYEHDGVALIIDGKVRIEIPEYELTVIAEVKQVKGLGTADADKLKELNHFHIELLAMFTDTANVGRTWSANSILRKMQIIMHGRDPTQEFKQANWRRPISEFVRKKILLHPPHQPTRYYTDFPLAEKTLNDKKFQS